MATCAFHMQYCSLNNVEWMLIHSKGSRVGRNNSNLPDYLYFLLNQTLDWFSIRRVLSIGIFFRIYKQCYLTVTISWCSPQSDKPFEVSQVCNQTVVLIFWTGSSAIQRKRMGMLHDIAPVATTLSLKDGKRSTVSDPIKGATRWHRS